MTRPGHHNFSAGESTDPVHPQGKSGYALKKARQGEIADAQERGEAKVWNSAAGIITVPEPKRAPQHHTSSSYHAKPTAHQPHRSIHTAPNNTEHKPLHYSGNYDSPGVTPASRDGMPQAQVTVGTRNFIRACMEELEKKPSTLPTLHYDNTGQTNSFAIAMRGALNSHVTQIHLSAMKAPTASEFSQLLYDRFLITAYDGHSAKFYKLLQPVHGNQGHYELKPEIGQAVALFAQQCVTAHGALLAPAITTSPSR